MRQIPAYCQQMPVIDLSDGGPTGRGGATDTIGAPTSASLLVAPAASLEQRIIAATLRCVSRWGVAKSTLDDIAREAGCSRATVYRVFPGGKDVVLLATARHEVEALLSDVAAAADGATTLAGTVTASLATAVRWLHDHPALQYLAEHEPEVILPWIAFDGLDPILALVTTYFAPRLGRYLPEREAAELAEALCRVVVSHAFESADDAAIDLTSEQEAGRFADTFLLPGYRSTTVHHRS